MLVIRDVFSVISVNFDDIHGAGECCAAVAINLYIHYFSLVHITFLFAQLHVGFAIGIIHFPILWCRFYAAIAADAGIAEMNKFRHADGV
jgi:hypothetical protein